MSKFFDYSQEKYKTASGSKDGPSLNELAIAYYHTRDNGVREKIAEQAERERIVESIARKIAHKIERPFLLEELICDGNFGLIQAIESYDPTTGFKFITHLVGRVRGAILDGLRESDPLERLDRKRLKIMKDFKEKFISENKTPPSREDYQRYWIENKWPPDSFDSFYESVLGWKPMQSLNKRAGNKSSRARGERGDSLQDSRYNFGRIVESRELLEILEKDLQAIPVKYRDGLRAFLLEGIFHKEAGEIIGVSESGFSLILKRYMGPDFFKRTRAYIND